MSVPNYYSGNKVVGAVSGTPNRALVVNIQDPLKAGRVQIRVVGHHDDEIGIPDEKLPWVKVHNTTVSPSMQTATSTHGLIPGAMVFCQQEGDGGQDWIVTGSVPNDRKDDNQAIHPATQGKGATDNIFPVQEYIQKTYGWGSELKQIVENKATQFAKQVRDQAKRKSHRTAEPCSESRDNCPIPDHYGKRTASKDPNGGTIGVFKFQGKDAQQFIQKVIQNKSAIVPNALQALQQLKSVNGKPTSIQSIGAGNFSSIMSQLSSWFSKTSGQQEKENYDCEKLINTPDSKLNADQKAQKAICLMLADPKIANDPGIIT